jgi:DNA-binding transcriptional MerR regulator
VADDALTAGAVARRLGVAVTTLRTWHQRYGLGPSHHVPGQHRRYTPEDLDRLDVMRRLTAQGVAPAEAAAWARRVPFPTEPIPPADATASPPGTARDGGGHAIAVGRAGPAARGLARAAMRLDGPALRDILELTVAGHGVITAWDEVILPVLVGIGERYQATDRFIEVEHLVSRSITEVLGSVPRPDTGDMPQVLLAAADEEQHTLPLEALAAALAESGVPSRLLGARVPLSALLTAVQRTGPSVVVIWSQLPHTADPDQLAEVLATPHRPIMVAAAGPGWSKDGLPGEATMLSSLTGAVTAVKAAIRPH